MGKKIITFDFKEQSALYAAYMPFVESGAIFIPTKQVFLIGEQVGLNLRFLDDHERYELDAKVVWITPLGAQGGKPAGIGVQFEGDKGSVARSRIETLLAAELQSDESTHTM